MKPISFFIYSLMYMVIAGVVAFVMGFRILEVGKAIKTLPKKYTEIEKINDTNYLNIFFEVFDGKIKSFFNILKR